jgi:hypothetical protein
MYVCQHYVTFVIPVKKMVRRYIFIYCFV